MRWAWPALIGGLLVAGLLLAWADSTLLRGLFPQPFGAPGRGEVFGRPATLPPPLGGRGYRGGIIFRGLGAVGGLYTFWWFVAAGIGAVLACLGAVVAAPRRTRVAAEQVQVAALPMIFAAGFAAILLGLAVTLLLRTTFFLLSLVPFVWVLALTAGLFGFGVLAVAIGRRLADRLGAAPPLVAALGAVLLLFDIGLVPVLGWVALALIAVLALGVAAVTRLGSDRGWSLEDLNW